jgi:hypothetical protein
LKEIRVIVIPQRLYNTPSEAIECQYKSYGLKFRRVVSATKNREKSREKHSFEPS